MGRENSQPFERGCTWYNGGFIPNFASPPPCYTGPPGGFNVEGKEYLFEDGAVGSGTEDKGYGTGCYVRVRCVRNNAGFNIKPGQLCTFTTTYVDGVTTVPNGLVVGGVTESLAEYCYPADEFLPPAGVPQGDLFYIVVEGPCLLKLAATLTAGVSAGQKVVSATASGTTDASAGCIVPQSINEGTDTDNVANANQIQNAIGRAMSAAPSGETGQSILVDIGWE